MSPRLPLLLLPLAAGCAGNLADYIGDRGSIVSPQLIRYGFDLEQSRCASARLGAALRPLQLRLLVRAAAAIRAGYFEPGRLTPRDFAHVAAAMADQRVGRAVRAVAAECNVDLEPPPPAPVAIVAVPAPRPPTWLNLGTAGSGQGIAVDAATIDQQGATRTAWFRLTDPETDGPSSNVYLLLIDCAARTIDPRSRERRDQSGAVLEHVDYPNNPLPVEGGTVMEIAFLSMCT